jgi:3-oxoacyl-[acyl-carrier protein] reductase
MASLDGRVAVITGSARNIGRTTALRLARDGAAVMVHARADQAGVDETVGLLRQNGAKAASHLADISQEAGARSLIEATVATFGRLDILVNNAAIRRNIPIEKMTLAEWRAVLGASLDGSFLCTMAAVPHMRKNGWGRIVNISGVSMFKGLPGRAAVSAAKAGMIGMARSLATELAPDGITVNCVAPGIIDTQRGVAAGARPDPALWTGIPVGRDGTVDEVAHIIAMLCQPEAAYTTGQTVHVNGGSYYS